MILAALIAAATPAAAANYETLQARFADWSVFAPEGEATCWISTTPMSSETMRGGVIAQDDRETYLIFTLRPGSNGIPEMSYVFGRAFDPGSAIRLLAPLAGFDMFQQDGWAWLRKPQQDRALVQAISHAEAIIQPFHIQTGASESRTSDRFSAQGFSAALQDATRRCP
ncbi:MAG: hypothetical protein KDK00_04910 [Rhodobacteraceae bacterium]|nr:hypothetical protein [Paracoccaceae bacterium]